ncbi:hypothetical protein jhhlp_000460 [Lomentospora prolificans]|uniref:Extragenic suppressor of kinetochore protein 1 n=1 Tax=Lomentospora prolificans TaxID=41688 RepID=A0A2N3NL34_9PEZI|nr:hypothetical protein jhhlp_000460 [Lomentospora prolificans]
MFWRFGGYANISTIDTLLDKPDFTLENLLDEADLLHEIKQHNAKLIEYLRDEPVLEQLLDYVVAPKLEPVTSTPENDDAPSDNEKAPSTNFPFARSRASSRATSEPEEDEGEKKRNRYAYVASEVLASDTWSIYEALMENGNLIRNFWQFLKRPSPLDPLQASYFTKVNEALFEKKTEEMIELLKSFPNAVADLLSHVECPMIMDLLLKVIALDRTEGGQGIVEWLYSQDVIPILLSCLSPDRNWVVQTAAGDFIKAIITISANASQNEQQCIGPNELTRQLVSRPCVQQLIKYMLTGGNPLTVGVGIVIEVIRKNNSDYDPDVGADEGSAPSCRDPIYLGTLLRLFADHVPDFMNLIMNAPAQKKHMSSTFGEKLEPLGFDRFKTCELMAELLHCSNMGLMNEVGSEELIAARDSERHRLRHEGKLIPRREDEASISADDLTMRFSHNTAHSDNRRLEVTNIAEDDGFEEVEHSREMNEDTSHEFVKAEEEIPPPVPIPSFFDKDEDELVDEPLSSPRLQIKDDGDIESPQFDDPDLVVAPLSPRKKTTEAVTTTLADVEKPEVEKGESAKPTTEEFAKEDAKQEKADPNPETDASPAHVEQRDDASDSSALDTPTTSTTAESLPDQDAPSRVVEASQADTNPAAKSEPESKKPTEESTATKQPEVLTVPEAPEPPKAPAIVTSDKATTDAPAEKETKVDESLPAAPAPPSSSSEPSAKSGTDTEKGGAEEEGDQPGVESIIIRAVPDPPFEANRSSIQPVVGDYLKMQFVEHRVVPTILTFFFKYPWNNFLHNVVYDVVQQVFNGPMDRGYNPTLAVSLFEAADVTTAIIQGQLASDESQAKTKTRMGYMGHLTLIAEEVVKFTERHPPELLSETVLERVMSPDWVNYVEGALAETRERDNAILGGVRPEVAMSNRAAAMSGLSGVGLSGLGGSMSLGNSLQSGASNALAEAGLNGSLDLNSDNGGSGIGPFTISAGTMMSGFGSSSDEEEDEAEDTEEDINNEFRSYTDPLNNNGSSLDPPSIPPPLPPPPPLNIPPSRARLQLAARLAMHQKNAAAAAAAAASEESTRENGDSENGEETSTSEPAVPAPLRNPFGDGAYEVDSDEEDHGLDSGAGWCASERGSWWRSVVTKNRDDDLGNDSDGVDDDEDEEFGDFAMPEVDSGNSNAGPKVIRPLAVHPPSGNAQKSAFGGLWPFANTGFGNKGEDTEGEVKKPAEADSSEPKPADGPVEETKTEPEATATPTTTNNAEAKKRTTLDDTDDEVVV